VPEHDTDDSGRRSLFDLVRSVPELIQRLIRDELRAARAEAMRKTKSLGVGVGILVAGAVLALYGLGFLFGSAVDALELIFQPWLAALIVGAVLVVLAAILAMVGLRALKKGAPPVPTETIDSVKQDIHAVKGER